MTPQELFRQWLLENIAYCQRSVGFALSNEQMREYRTQLDVFNDALVKFDQTFPNEVAPDSDACGLCGLGREKH